MSALTVQFVRYLNFSDKNTLNCTHSEKTVGSYILIWCVGFTEFSNYRLCKQHAYLNNVVPTLSYGPQ